MTSPFKFLDAFEQRDRAIFFGRSDEIEQLYRLVFEADLVLVYGASGTGKTSLIQCGLANRFAATDWFQLFVRRTDDINAALDREIHARALTPIEPGTPVVDAIQSLYLDYLRPIYLIFDQFEEVFILGSREEQDRFFITVADILASKLSCKIIISLREEYLASLHRFEEIVPTLFNKRLRIEAMSMTNVEQVITGTTHALGIQLEHGGATAKRIIEQLDDGRVGVQLAYLQVYLDSLYERSIGGGETSPIVFTDAAVEETGKLGDIMGRFLENQTEAIQSELAVRYPGIPGDGVQHLLEEFVTVEGTKQPTSRAEIVTRLPGVTPWIDDALSQLQTARILRNVDDRYELAHDALARPICERQSGERKAMLLVQKIVRDRLSAYPQTKTRLSAEELAVVNRSRRQVDTIRGTPLLELTPEESEFVGKSASKLRWRRFRLVGAIVSIGAIMLMSITLMIASLLEVEDNVVAATNETDWLGYRSYSFLVDNEDPYVASMRRTLLEGLGRVNSTRENALLDELEAPDTFWPDLSAVDLRLEDGEVAEAKKQYAQLESAWRSELEADPYNLRARVRLKAILWRRFTAEEAGQDRVRILKSLLEVITPEDAYPPLDFSYDLADACSELTLREIEDERCAGHVPEGQLLFDGRTYEQAREDLKAQETAPATK